LYQQSTAIPGSIPLFSNLGATGPTSGLSFLNATNNMRLDLILTMAETRGLLKVLSRPRVVTQNNIQAVVKQGVRVPIVTQAQLGGPPTSTYVDAFLRLTVTPQITSEGTIFLNVDVENTLPNFGVEDSQGNPELITQQATTQVLVTDGGTVVIGGVIQTQNTLAVSQVPVLGDIPYLGNLFKHRTVTTQNQELIFFITPRIIQT
jgi:type IV pilus assembly protein PilQ